jgi:hypothetical protein
MDFSFLFCKESFFLYCGLARPKTGLIKKKTHNLFFSFWVHFLVLWSHKTKKWILGLKESTFWSCQNEGGWLVKRWWTRWWGKTLTRTRRLPSPQQKQKQKCQIMSKVTSKKTMNTLETYLVCNSILNLKWNPKNLKWNQNQNQISLKSSIQLWFSISLGTSPRILVSILFNDRTKGWFPPDSNNWILTIKFWVHPDPKPGSCKWAHQGTWPTLVARGGSHSKLEPTSAIVRMVCVWGKLFFLVVLLTYS